MAYRLPGLTLLLVLLLAPATPAAQMLAISETSSEARTHFDQGRAALLDIETEAAREHFDAAIAADPDFTLAYIYRAFSAPPAQREERMRVAAEHASNATADERALLTALQSLLDSDAGLADVNTTIARFPDDAHMQYIAGVLNYQSDQFDAAEAALELAIAADPNMGGAHNILGYARLAQEDHAGAEAAFLEYIRLNPTHANPHDSLGEFYLRTGRLDEAETHLRHALERDPEFAASINNLAWVHIERVRQADEQAIARGDAAAVAALHTPGGALLPPGSPPVIGREAITQFWQGGLSAGPVTVDMETDEVIARDNMAHELGTYTFSAGGQTEVGKYMSIWLRGDDGVWRIHRDIWSSNSAPGAHD